VFAIARYDGSSFDVTEFTEEVHKSSIVMMASFFVTTIVLNLKFVVTVDEDQVKEEIMCLTFLDNSSLVSFHSVGEVLGMNIRGWNIMAHLRNDCGIQIKFNLINSITLALKVNTRGLEDSYGF
jgi:hypothetical protein